MSLVEVQEFEKEAIPIESVIQSFSISYRPFISVLGEPVDVLHCDEAKLTCAFKELRGSWSSVKARPGMPSASRTYAVRVGPLAAPKAKLYIFKDSQRIGETETDEKGRATINLSADEPSTATYTVSLLPVVAPFKTPFQDSFAFTVWLVTCKVTNRTDRWWRFVGRSFEESLPRIFWRNPRFTIGLAAPYGTQVFVDVVPVFSDKNITLEYGISAFCNTEEPYPPHDKCVRYRRNTWWRFEIEAFNGKEIKKASGDLNLDRHLRVTFYHDRIESRVIRPAGAET